MGALEAQALSLRFPNDLGRTANEFGWKNVAVTGTHAAETLPAEFRGRVIYVMNTHATDFCHLAVSLSSAAEVDAGAAAGTSAKVGIPVPPATLLRLGPLPDWDKTATAYLIHESSSGALTLYYGLGDG
jgi:hypothetical protein